MVDQTAQGVVADHVSLQHQIELQLEAHPEIHTEEELLDEYREIRRLEGALPEPEGHYEGNF